MFVLYHYASDLYYGTNGHENASNKNLAKKFTREEAESLLNKFVFPKGWSIVPA